MTKRSFNAVLFYLGWGLFASILGWNILPALFNPRGVNGQEKPAEDDKPPVIRRPLKPKEGEAPPADQLFVWSLPDEGDQSVMILKVIDADTLDVALLHPIRVKLKGGAKKWKADELAKEIEGKLLQMRIGSKDEKEDRATVTIHLGKDQGWLHDRK